MELQQEIMGRLFETAQIAAMSMDELTNYEYIMRTERDLRNQISYAREEGKEEGLAEGMERGREEGMLKGLQKGRKQGILKGIEKGILQVARRMLECNTPIETIVLYTGLSEEEVRRL